MTKPSDSGRNTVGTFAAEKDVSRRTVVKGLAAGTALAAGPFYVGKAFAGSGEVSVYSWTDYINEDIIKAFTDKTGIKVNHSVYGTNNEVLQKLRASQGKGFDVVFPSVTTLQAWYDAGDLLRPIDESKINVGTILPALWEKSLDLGATRRGKRYAVPFNWGTEGLTFNSAERNYSPGEASWNDLWSEENKGFVTVRPRSALSMIALMQDGTGERLDAAQKDEAMARDVFDKALKFALDHKPNIRAFWKDTPTIQNNFLHNNALVGMCWDGPSFGLWKETDGRIKYLAPKEGAFAWLDTMCIPTGAENVPEAYAFINFMVSPEGGGMHAKFSGYNSAAIGAEKALDEGQRERFKYAYNDGKAISQLYWWKPEAQWFQQLRNEYIDKYQAA
jgi:spermidine/putrescine transport system substrate-binding protein